jgi:hypothetical protein
MKGFGLALVVVGAIWLGQEIGRALRGTPRADVWLRRMTYTLGGLIVAYGVLTVSMLTPTFHERHRAQLVKTDCDTIVHAIRLYQGLETAE